jgi:eukaryotic-like serine/threonine-protein kinase
MPDYSGKFIGRYHIFEKLGEGGMAVVYKAFDTRLERDVAIKLIRMDAFPPVTLERVLARFEREAKFLARLDHPNIVAIFDYGEFEGAPYLVMPYLPGGTLKNMTGKPIPYQGACNLLIPIAQGLEYAHQHSVIHRDVKPSNILISTDGIPRISDFGIGKLLEEEGSQTLTGTGVGVGTPEYMAPEQWLNRVTPQSDIYSLGIIFYELVTGRVPYRADTPAALLLKQNTDPLPQPKKFVPDLPKVVERVLFKALAKKPENRYPTMREFEMALEGLSTESLRIAQASSKHHNLEGSAIKKVSENGKMHFLGRLPMSFWSVLAGIGLLGLVIIISLTRTPKVGTDLATLVTNRSSAVIPSQTSATSIQVTKPVLISTVLPPIVTSTMVASVTPSLPVASPQGTMILPVQSGMPLPVLKTGIDSQNANRLEELARWDTGIGVSSIAISPDGKMLASGSLDHLVKLWRITDGTLISKLQGHSSGVNSVAYSPDGQMLASVSADGAVKLWRVKDATLMNTLPTEYWGDFNSVTFSPDGQMLALGSGDGMVALWGINPNISGNSLRGGSDIVSSVAFSPDGQLLASSSGDNIKLWKVKDGSLVYTIKGHTDSVNSVSFSSDGQMMVSGSSDHTVKLWRVRDGGLVHTLLGNTSVVNSVVFSPDGQMVAAGLDDNTVKLWRVSGGSLPFTLKGHTSSVHSVAFSSDGQILASGSSDGTIRLWGIYP